MLFYKFSNLFFNAKQEMFLTAMFFSLFVVIHMFRMVSLILANSVDSLLAIMSGETGITDFGVSNFVVS